MGADVYPRRCTACYRVQQSANGLSARHAVPGVVAAPCKQRRGTLWERKFAQLLVCKAPRTRFNESRMRPKIDPAEMDLIRSHPLRE